VTRGDQQHHMPVDDNESTGESNAAHSDKAVLAIMSPVDVRFHKNTA